MRIEFRRRKVGVRYCERITQEHKTRLRWLWQKRLTDATRHVEALSNRPGNIEDWTETTRARTKFAHVWYQYKLRYGSVAAEDLQAYIVMTAI